MCKKIQYLLFYPTAYLNNITKRIILNKLQVFCLLFKNVYLFFKTFKVTNLYVWKE